MSEGEASGRTDANTEDPFKLRKQRAEALQAEAAADTAIAAAEQARTEARRAALGALIPDSKTQPLEGKVTTGEGFGSIADSVAYGAIAQLGRSIAEEMIGKADLAESAVVLVTDDPNLWRADAQALQVSARLANLRSLIEQETEVLDQLLSDVAEPEPGSARGEPGADALEEVRRLSEMALENVPDLAIASRKAGRAVPTHKFTAAALGSALVAGATPVAQSLALVGGAVGLAADIAGYLRTDYSITSRVTDVSDESVRLATAGAMAAKRAVYLQGQCRLESAQVVRDLNDVDALRLELALKAVECRIRCADPIERRIRDLEGRELEDAEREKAAVDARLATVTQLVTLWDVFVGALTSSADGAPSAFERVAAQQRLDELGVTHLLHITVSDSGGEAITERSIWTWFRGQRMTFIGGGAVTYALTDTRGRVLSADVKYDFARRSSGLAADGKPIA